jgi:excisionase family DNA binding protein
VTSAVVHPPTTPERETVEALPVSAAASRLGVSPSTIRNWVARDIISAYRLPTGARRIPVEEIKRLEHEMFAKLTPVPLEVTGGASPLDEDLARPIRGNRE